VSVDGVPEMYARLPSADRVVRMPPPGPFDLAIGVDADGPDRLGAAEAAILSCPAVIDIDHHPGADRYGSLQLIDPTPAATGEEGHRAGCWRARGGRAVCLVGPQPGRFSRDRRARG